MIKRYSYSQLFAMLADPTESDIARSVRESIEAQQKAVPSVQVSSRDVPGDVLTGPPARPSHHVLGDCIGKASQGLKTP